MLDGPRALCVSKHAKQHAQFCILYSAYLGFSFCSPDMTMQMIGSAWQSDESNENNNIVTSSFSLPGELFIESNFLKYLLNRLLY